MFLERANHLIIDQMYRSTVTIFWSFWSWAHALRERKFRYFQTFVVLLNDKINNLYIFSLKKMFTPYTYHSRPYHKLSGRIKNHLWWKLPVG